MKKTNLSHKLAALFTVGIFMGESGEALSADTFSSTAGNIQSSLSSVPNLIATFAYIAGVGLGVAGVFKLKSHVDNPGNVPMKDGLVRLGAGGGLLVLPYLTQVMQGSISGSNTAGTAAGIGTFDAIK